MATTNNRYGYKCKLMVGAKGTTATTELKIIGDVTINDSRTDIDVSSRLTNGLKSHVGGLRDITIEINMEHLPLTAYPCRTGKNISALNFQKAPALTQNTFRRNSQAEWS